MMHGWCDERLTITLPAKKAEPLPLGWYLFPILQSLDELARVAGYK